MTQPPPRDFAPCDQDSEGGECATVVVYTASGQIQLCSHHFQRHKSAFPPGYIAVPMVPDSDDLPELARLELSSPGGHGSFTMRDHW